MAEMKCQGRPPVEEKFARDRRKLCPELALGFWQHLEMQ